MQETAAATRKPALPPGPAAYVALATLAAACLFAFALVQTLPGAGLALLGGMAVFAAGFLLLERQAVVLVWDRERVTAALTEVSVILGLLALPPAALILAVPVPRTVMGIATRRPFIKSLFNVATGVLSVGAAWGAFALARYAGLPPLGAAVLGTAAYAVCADLLMAGLFGLLEGSLFLTVYRKRFLRPNVLAVVYGVAAGVMLYALWSLHPVAALAAAPLLWLLHRYTAYEARADREISLYKSLARESQALIGVDRREVIAERTLALSMAGLGAPKVIVRLENGASWERTDGAADVLGQPWLSAPILGREGRRLGEMSVWRRPGRRSDPAHDEALLRIIASQTGHALESAEALVEVARQRDVVARQEKLSALGSLVAGVAHEVNNPLTYLGGNIELALLDLEDLQERYARSGETPPIDLAETQRLLATALGGAQRIGEIVKALRAVARAKGSTERERVPMNKIAQNVCELMRIGVPDGVVLRCEPDAQDPAVMGFSSELHQVVLNLAKNAVEATTGKGGTVIVSVRSTGDRVELRVADEGMGMTEETRKRLFTPFFTTKGASGTGLGLSIVGSIVKEHSGEIAVESETGKGTTFRVFLPRV
jgi:signal transduction histidine kinase